MALAAALVFAGALAFAVVFDVGLAVVLALALVWRRVVIMFPCLNQVIRVYGHHRAGGSVVRLGLTLSKRGQQHRRLSFDIRLALVVHQILPSLLA